MYKGKNCWANATVGVMVLYRTAENKRKRKSACVARVMEGDGRWVVELGAG